MTKDIDEVIYKKKDKDMPPKKTTTKKKETIEYKEGIGLDVGTGFICSASLTTDGKVDFTSLRDAFFPIEKEVFQKQMFNKNSMMYVELGDNINVIGEDALTLAKIRNTSTKRPLSSGFINPSERNAAPILKEMFRFCTEKYKVKDGEKIVYSVPGHKVGEENFSLDYHSMSLESLLNSFGLQAEPLNEAYAVVISELEKTNDVTGIGFSFGAGLVNVAFVYKSMLMFNFSIGKSGDFIDFESARTVGESESKMNHIKEKSLDLSKNEFEVSPEERALMFAYRHVIKNTIQQTIKAFTDSKDVNIFESIPLVISGGTSMPKGFGKMFEDELQKHQTPFEVSKVIEAKDKLTAVARGCALYASQG